MILSAIAYLLCGVLLVASAWLIHHEDPDATVTALFDAIMADRVVRIAIVVIWWWIGWHFLAGQTLDPGFG